MFKENNSHLQKDLFGLINNMPEKHKKYAVKSEEHHFYQLIFSHIDETLFSALYSNIESRPNAPINAMVAALIMQNRKVWSYEELFQNIRFNVLTRLALGLDDMESMPFCMATLFNFQTRLNNHLIETGDNLLEMVFDGLTKKQLHTLKLKTHIQRTDSTMVASNIRKYSRVQLLVEIILRMHRMLSDEDKVRYNHQFEKYTQRTSAQYVYTLKASDLPHTLKDLGMFFSWMYRNLKSSYEDQPVFKIFERIFDEHFIREKRKVTVKSPKELHSGCIQSPDDLEATYRDKNGKTSKGQTICVTETADPENKIQLLTDIAITPNNVDDSVILNQRIDKQIKKTPDLKEIHFDGAFGSYNNDIRLKEHKIRPIQTAIRGKESTANIEIEEVSNGEYQVRCPYQTVRAVPARKRYKAMFDSGICIQCPSCLCCPVKPMKKCHTYYFTYEDYLRQWRTKQIGLIPLNRRKLRNNVEATIKEFTCKIPHGKLKVRGAFKTSVFAYSMGISINFGRIHRLILSDGLLFKDVFKELILFMSENYNILFGFWFKRKNCYPCFWVSI